MNKSQPARNRWASVGESPASAAPHYTAGEVTPKDRGGHIPSRATVA
jgi:hypothetical protein